VRRRGVPGEGHEFKKCRIAPAGGAGLAPRAGIQVAVGAVLERKRARGLAQPADNEDWLDGASRLSA
jgi:hypothetical protein